MTPTNDAQTGAGGGDGDGLSGSTINASTQTPLGGIMARKRPDLFSVEQKRYLLISRSRDKIARKADGGRPLEAIREIPVNTGQRRLEPSMPWSSHVSHEESVISLYSGSPQPDVRAPNGRPGIECAGQ